MEDKSPFGECFSLLFNLIISQLFIGAVASLIELIRILAINILSRYILKEEYIQKYGLYIQPLITCVLLTVIGISVYYISKWTSSDGCNNSDFIRYFLYFILVIILIAFVCFFAFYYFRISQKQKVLNGKKFGYKISDKSK